MVYNPNNYFPSQISTPRNRNIAKIGECGLMAVTHTARSVKTWPYPECDPRIENFPSITRARIYFTSLLRTKAVCPDRPTQGDAAIKRGFSIIRISDTFEDRRVIRMRTPEKDWHHYGSYPTQGEFEKVWNELIANPMILEG